MNHRHGGQFLAPPGPGDTETLETIILVQHVDRANLGLSRGNKNELSSRKQFGVLYFKSLLQK